MSKEKQIKKMSQDLSECIDYDEWAAREYGETYVDYDSTAFNMVARGWSKQSEGEWVTNAWDGKKWIIIPYKKHEHIGAHCSVCNKRALLNSNKDEVTSNFCPNCGAKMKGD